MKARDSSKDIDNLHSDDGTPFVTDIWSDGVTLWVMTIDDDTAYAYTLSTGARDSGKDIEMVDENSDPYGMWSDGHTMWVTNATITVSSRNIKVYAYNLRTGERERP